MADDGLMDPNEGRKLERVDTERLFQLLEWECIKAGINKYSNLDGYRNAIEQMEILGIGSALLDPEYYKDKENLVKKYKKKEEEVAKKLLPKAKRSAMNDSINKDLANFEVEYVTDWHRLLMKRLAKLFYTHYVIETIGGKKRGAMRR
jgi:hypothetical protein